MRYLSALILAIYLASPALADSYCRMHAQHNCDAQITEQLLAVTKNTIHNLQKTQDPHPFKTENDFILARHSTAPAEATQHATLASGQQWSSLSGF